LLISYAAGNQALTPAWPVGLQYKASLCYYPSATPQRVLLNGNAELINDKYAAEPIGLSIDQSLTQYATALSTTPWLLTYPMVLNNVGLHFNNATNDGFTVVQFGDPANQIALPIFARFNQQWDWLALTGAQSCSVSGEWDGEVFTPLALWFAGQCMVFRSEGLV
jgi:hypothetical protein